MDFNQAIAIVGAIGSHWVHRMSEDSQEEEGVPLTGTRGSPSANLVLFLFFEFWFYLVIIVILAGFGL